MIYYSVPYNSDKNIGKYYNDFMKILPNDEDFACFVDGDTIFTTPDFGSIIESVVEEYPQIECFTCLTNRVGCKWQVLPGIDEDNNDMSYHREIGLSMKVIYSNTCVDVTDVSKWEVMSGVLILISKRLWKKIGGFKEDGMLGIDNDLHWKIQQHNEKIYLMKGLYLYHWYRWPNPKNKTHLL